MGCAQHLFWFVESCSTILEGLNDRDSLTHTLQGGRVLVRRLMIRCKSKISKASAIKDVDQLVSREDADKLGRVNSHFGSALVRVSNDLTYSEQVRLSK
jgi:hypothetical protein